jgi:hypothetical protein
LPQAYAIALFSQSKEDGKYCRRFADAAGDAGENLKSRFSDFEKQAKELLKREKLRR